MNFHGFVGQVQHRAHLGTLDDAVAATRATLNTLGERLPDAEKRHLISQLPREVGHYLEERNGGERFSLDEFFHRVSEREKEDLPVAVFHARVVCDVLQDAVAVGETEHLLCSLPREYMPLFQSGSEGHMKKKA